MSRPNRVPALIAVRQFIGRNLAWLGLRLLYPIQLQTFARPRLFLAVPLAVSQSPSHSQSASLVALHGAQELVYPGYTRPDSNPQQQSRAEKLVSSPCRET